MLTRIIEFSIRNKLIVGLFILALVGYGIYQTTKLPIDAVPDITDNQVQVITIAPSFGATDIERLVTFPIEQANSNINGIKEIRSFSRFGLSLVTIVFNNDVDVYWARQQVAERLQQVQSQIPAGIGSPELGPITTGLGEIYQYVVRAKDGFKNKYDETDLRTIQDWIVRRQLIGVKGVAEVSSFGGKLKQYEIAVDPNKLQSYGLTVNDVFTALEKNNQNTGGAYIEKGATVLFIRSEGLIGSVNDIENIAVSATNSGTPIMIKDLAEVQTGYATRYGAMTYNDEGEVSGAVVMMLKGANSSEVIKNVKERIEQIRKTLPEGIVIEPFLDRTKMVNNAISTVVKNLIEGALIVVFILVLFLGNFRAGLLVASVIPLSLLFAIILMNTFGVSGNLMSLGALDFGLIVDGAVIIVEAVMHQLYHSKKLSGITLFTQKQMDTQVKESASKMMNSAVFGQIIILIVYLPIFTLEGIEGKMFKPMAQTVAFALLGAFILSITYVPMMSAFFLKKTNDPKPGLSDRIMFQIERRYQHLLEKVLQFPKTIIATVVVMFISAIVILTNLGGEFIPALEEGDFAVDTRVLTGSNLNTTIEGTQKAAHILKTRFPEVEKVVTKIGSGEVPTDPMPIEASDMMVILKDKSEWTSAKTFDELAAKMSKALEDVPGITAGFQYPVQMRFNELMTGARQDVVCKIFGENLDTLAFYADKMGVLVNEVEGSRDLYVEPVTGMPQIVIEYNRAVLAQYNMNIADVNRVVNIAFAGQSTGLVFEGERRFELVVRLSSQRRENLDDVKNLLIPTPNGNQIPLYQLAEVSIKNGPNQIQREDAKRRIVVGFNVRGRDVQTIVNELQKKVEDKVKLPAGYYITYGGAFENLLAAKSRLLIAVPVSLLLIFLLLFFAFNSVKHGLLIYTAIPLSAIGGIYFLALRGMPFSISAGVGFIALFGVAVLNGIVLIAEFNRLKKDGMADLRRIVIMGTKVRLRPVLMTAFVASLGFLPMALSNGSGAEVQRPLATVVIGGLLIATFLTLFLLPILYVMFETVNLSKVKTGSGKVGLLIAGFLLAASSFVNAQKSLTLNEAIEIALKNNTSVRNERLQNEYQLRLSKSAINIPQAGLGFEYGQFNSINNDVKWSVSQSLSFPTVYAKQKSVLKETYNSGMLNLVLKEAELRKQVSEVFFRQLYLQQKEAILLQTDSIYSGFLSKAELRFEKGESGALEKIMAESQRSQVGMQLKQLQLDKEMLALRFQLLLNVDSVLVPSMVNTKLELAVTPDTSAIRTHPSILVLDQQKKISLAQVKLERSRLMPDLLVGYNWMSIEGLGPDNVVYDNSPNFKSAQFGIGVPLFFGSQKGKVKAAKYLEVIAENNYQTGLISFRNELLAASKEYELKNSNVSYFESKGLQNAIDMKNIASAKFVNGEINFLEWAILINNSASIQSNYIEAVNDLNMAIIQLNYLTIK
ncbi:MAG: CusA/CzcA family heavy metal efflux RND transporter [Bacteroidetes bacterium]|nr:CusA/CzcA family heavy metal efflux RND transporter [Bacteroidota bacterium]